MKNFFYMVLSWFLAFFNVKKPVINYPTKLKRKDFKSTDLRHWGSGMGSNGSTAFVKGEMTEDLKLPIKYYVYPSLIATNWIGELVKRIHSGTQFRIMLPYRSVSFTVLFNESAWYAIWLLGNDNNQYKELDIFETFNKIKPITKMTVTKHLGDSSSLNRTQKCSHYFVRTNNPEGIRFNITRRYGILTIKVNGFTVNQQPNIFINPPELLFTAQAGKIMEKDGLMIIKNITVK